MTVIQQHLSKADARALEQAYVTALAELQRRERIAVAEDDVINAARAIERLSQYGRQTHDAMVVFDNARAVRDRLRNRGGRS